MSKIDVDTNAYLNIRLKHIQNTTAVDFFFLALEIFFHPVAH